MQQKNVINKDKKEQREWKARLKKTIQNFKQSNVINKDKQEQMNTFLHYLH